MLTVILNAEQKVWLENAILRATIQVEQFVLAYDPIDNAIKWKVGNSVWSPPVTIPVPLCWCTNHQYCQCSKHPQECPGSWHRNRNWSGRAECDECIEHNC